MIAHEVRDKRNNVLSGNRFFKIYFILLLKHVLVHYDF